MGSLSFFLFYFCNIITGKMDVGSLKGKADSPRVILGAGSGMGLPLSALKSCHGWGSGREGREIQVVLVISFYYS